MENRPVHQGRLNGIRLAIFENTNTEGHRWYSCSPSRQYLESGSKEAKYTATFNGVADLVLLRQLISNAIDWLNQRESESEEA
jgi:hypothetical protein